ncbi:28254_t:CDS:2 [Dentiscutata erythropus]|uniref:28254_t:CDS:1 n=1 Tax=Dentiscutata erythropus TaxID=1348616 RepID=A0A9N9NNN2_9GLOM|nr:28254_t:CDS:2 [Dentiscutata erythropus]
MVLEYANGGNLHDYLRNNFENNEYKLKFEEQLCFAKDIALGLKFLHKEDIIHRDLQVMIADLGLSKLFSDDATRTRTGELKGRSPFQNASTPQILLNIVQDLREDPNPAPPLNIKSATNNEDDIVNKIKSQADKKFDEYILKTEQRISSSNTNIANLLQEFINLYIKDMVTNSDDTVNDINNWIKNNTKNSKKIFDFTMKFEIKHRETILAYFYMKGFGTNKDYKECLSWCKKGCEKEDIYSYYEAAYCYRYYFGTFEDYNEAFRYFNLAASGGILKAKCELAIMHMNGMGCEENKAKAFCLFKEAGEQNKLASCMISDWYWNRNKFN